MISQHLKWSTDSSYRVRVSLLHFLGLLQKQKEIELFCVTRYKCRFTGWKEKKILQCEFSITSSSYKPGRGSILTLYDTHADSTLFHEYRAVFNPSSYSRQQIYSSQQVIFSSFNEPSKFKSVNIKHLQNQIRYWTIRPYHLIDTAQHIFLYSANNCKHEVIQVLLKWECIMFR